MNVVVLNIMVLNENWVRVGVRIRVRVSKCEEDEESLERCTTLDQCNHRVSNPEPPVGLANTLPTRVRIRVRVRVRP